MESRCVVILALLSCLVVIFAAEIEAKANLAPNRDLRNRRGFKNDGLAAARGFGKRSADATYSDVDEM